MKCERVSCQIDNRLTENRCPPPCPLWGHHSSACRNLSDHCGCLLISTLIMSSGTNLKRKKSFLSRSATQRNPKPTQRSRSLSTFRTSFASRHSASPSPAAPTSKTAQPVLSRSNVPTSPGKTYVYPNPYSSSISRVASNYRVVTPLSINQED